MKTPRPNQSRERGSGPTRATPFFLSPDDKDRLAKVFRVLSDPTRLSVALALAEQEELSVNQLVDRLSLSQPAVSRSLQPLRSEEIVKLKKRAQRHFYSLNGEHVRTLLTEAKRHVDENR
jgi:DNA-binding transcriptional ArsR family regulator